MQKLNELHYSFLNSDLIKTFKNYLNKFFNSDIYFMVLMMVSLLNWKLRVIYLEIIFGLLIILLIYIFNYNRVKLIPVFLFAIISLRLLEKSDYLVPSLITAIITMPILFIDIFRKKANINNNIIIGMILILIAMIFSIVNAPNLITPILGILMWFFYTLLYIYIFNWRDDQDDIHKNRLYVAKSFMYLGIGILLQILLFYLEFRDGASALEFFTGKSIDLGWGISTFVSMTYLITIPLTCYYYIHYQKKYFLLIVIVLQLFGLMVLLSRGAYLALIILSIPFLVKFLGDINNKTEFMNKLLMIINITLLIALFIAIPTGFVKSFFEVLNGRGLSLSGRELLYRVGLNVFTRYPLFGGGVYTAEYYLSLVSSSVYYHNYIIQTIATIGIVGLGAFIYYFYHLIKQALIKGNYNNYVLYIVLGMIIHGLFDTTFYNPLVMIMLSIILPFMNYKKEIEKIE